MKSDCFLRIPMALMRSLLSFASVETDRPTLYGIAILSGCTIAATDGRRALIYDGNELCRHVDEAIVVPSLSADQSILLPRGPLDMLSTMVGMRRGEMLTFLATKKEGELEAHWSSRLPLPATTSIFTAVARIRLKKDEFPPLRQVVPAAGNPITPFELDPRYIADLTRACAVIDRGPDRGLDEIDNLFSIYPRLVAGGGIEPTRWDLMHGTHRVGTVVIMPRRP